MPRGGKRPGAGRKRVVDETMALAIGFDCEQRHQAERARKFFERYKERFAEYQVAAATFFPMSKRAGHFGPRMTSLTEKAETFLADMEAEREAIVGAKRYADAIAEQAEVAGKDVPRHIITGAAFASILMDMEADDDVAPYGVREQIICLFR